MQKLLKATHVLGSAGVLGALAACLVLDTQAASSTGLALAAQRADIAALVRWAVLPALTVTLVSGLLSTAANSLYHEARWVWIKAGLGLAIFEGTLFSVGAGTRRAAELAVAAVAGPASAELVQVLRTQTRGMWMLLGVAIVSTLLAVWRPRLRRAGASTGDRT